MEKLPMCRICLVKNVRMYVVVNKNLHELYEKLTDIPFVTGDCRPMLACFFCCTKLKQCCRLLRKCLEAEQLFAQMMNKDYERDPKINLDVECFNGFTKSPIVHTSIVDGDQTDSLAVTEELPDVSESLDYIIDLEEEHQAAKIELNHDNESYVEDTAALQAESDADDVPLMKIKNEEEDQHESIGAPVAKKPKLDTRKPQPQTISAEQKKNEAQHGVSSITNTSLGTSCHNNSNKDSIKCNKISKEGVGSEKGVEKHLKCDIFQCSCSVKTNLITHFLTNTDEKPFKCDICQRTFSQETNLVDHTRVHTCHSSFYLKHNLTDHIHSHTGEKPYKCDVCQSSFNKSHQLASHMRIHTGEKPFKCDICQCTFTHKSSLTCHIRAHTGEKPFKCDICPRSYSQKHNLTNHIRTHTDDNPFKCDKCHRSFHVKCHLKQHIRTHSGDKPYKCDICQSSFYLRHHLTNHIRIHTGERLFKCDICNKRFRRKGDLKYHTRVHTGEKPLKCAICQKSFSHKCNLKRHERTHKPFKCDICQQGFSEKSILNRHTCTHAGET